MTNLPADYSYSEEHEWIDATGNVAGRTVRVGVTNVAAEALGEIVFVELPVVGDTVTAGEPCGEIESTKSVSDIYSPVTGTVTAINGELDAEPGTINEDPFDAGWLFEVQVTEAGDLMDADAYASANDIK
ncbi:glycine cleavage system protein GcvH [Corynebacterium ulceribovis]|uniref:glycine cleavage system protein GcvH n=1 Tax=Corynebacterium ulceribovis TaxID=487732 RepID=UPI00036D804B|nr:glycine cleavage system protein GcvH [Corynebacterium ulceribovis]